MNNVPVDLDKPVMLSDGRPARIICTDRVSDMGLTVVALVTQTDHEAALYFKTDGTSLGRLTLVNVPPPNRFINLYNSGVSGRVAGYSSLKEAQKVAGEDIRHDWKGTLEETPDGAFVAFHPAKPERSCE